MKSPIKKRPVGRPRTSTLVSRAYRLPPETIAAIEQLAQDWGCSHAVVINRAIVSQSWPVVTWAPKECR